MTDPHSLRQAAEQAVSDVPLPDTIGVVREGHDGFPWKSIAEHHEAARIEIGTEVCAMPDVRDYGRACALAAMAAPVPLPLPKVDGDILPAIGSKVLIHLGSQDEWVEHTVVGYYVWPNHGLTASVFRVFVRVRDKGGSLNARCLQDIRYPDEPSPAEPQPVQAPSDLPEMIDAIITRLRSLRQSTPNTASSIWDEKYADLEAHVERCVEHARGAQPVQAAGERERCAKLCRDMMPAEGVIRRTLLDLERAILDGAQPPRPQEPPAEQETDLARAIKAARGGDAPPLPFNGWA